MPKTHGSYVSRTCLCWTATVRRWSTLSCRSTSSANCDQSWRATPPLGSSTFPRWRGCSTVRASRSSTRIPTWPKLHSIWLRERVRTSSFATGSIWTRWIQDGLLTKIRRQSYKKWRRSCSNAPWTVSTGLCECWTRFTSVCSITSFQLASSSRTTLPPIGDLIFLLFVSNKY